MNLARGTGIRGLSGIRPVNGCMIRPLLGINRKEIEYYLKEHQLSYCEDETNAGDELYQKQDPASDPSYAGGAG